MALADEPVGSHGVADELDRDELMTLGCGGAHRATRESGVGRRLSGRRVEGLAKGREHSAPGRHLASIVRGLCSLSIYEKVRHERVGEVPIHTHDLLLLHGKVHVLVGVPGREREAVDSLTEADDHLVGGYLSAIDCSDRLDDGRGDLLTNFGRAARFREPSDVNERHDATVYARARPTPQGKGQLRVATDESRIYWLPSPKKYRDCASVLHLPMFLFVTGLPVLVHWVCVFSIDSMIPHPPLSHETRRRPSRRITPGTPPPAAPDDGDVRATTPK